MAQAEGALDIPGAGGLGCMGQKAYRVSMGVCQIQLLVFPVHDLIKQNVQLFEGVSQVGIRCNRSFLNMLYATYFTMDNRELQLPIRRKHPKDCQKGLVSLHKTSETETEIEREILFKIICLFFVFYGIIFKE